MASGRDGIGDAELLELSGWSGVPTARVLAKAVGAEAAVFVLDSNGGLGGTPYETIELLVRDGSGAWTSDGDLGPAAGGGAGWFHGHCYAYGQAADDVRKVVLALSGEVVECEVQLEGWWIGIVRSPSPWTDGYEAVPVD